MEIWPPPASCASRAACGPENEKSSRDAMPRSKPSRCSGSASTACTMPSPSPLPPPPPAPAHAAWPNVGPYALDHEGVEPGGRMDQPHFHHDRHQPAEPDEIEARRLERRQDDRRRHQDDRHRRQKESQHDDEEENRGKQEP